MFPAPASWATGCLIVERSRCSEYARGVAEPGSVDDAFLQRDYETKLSTLGFSDPNTRSAENDLYRSYVDEGDLDAALRLSEEALTLAAEVFGEGDYEFEGIEMSIANTYSNLGRSEEARPIHLRLASAWLLRYGYDSEAGVAAIDNCEVTLRRLGDQPGVITLWSFVADFCAKTYGDDLRALSALSRLAEVQVEAGHFEESKSVHQSMLRLAVRLELDPRSIVDAKRLIVQDLAKTREWDLAFRLMEDIQRQATAELPPQDDFRTAMEALPRRVPRTPKQWDRFRRRWSRGVNTRTGEKVVAQIMALPYPKIVIPAPEQFRP